MIWWFAVVIGIALIEVGFMLMFSGTDMGIVSGGLTCVFGGIWLDNSVMEEKNENN